MVGCAPKRHRVTNRFCGHWLHDLSSEVKASIDGGVITTSELDLRAAFGRFFFAKRLPGLALNRHGAMPDLNLLMRSGADIDLTEFKFHSMRVVKKRNWLRYNYTPASRRGVLG